MLGDTVLTRGLTLQKELNACVPNSVEDWLLLLALGAQALYGCANVWLAAFF